jgi:hypothetical protein
MVFIFIVYKAAQRQLRHSVGTYDVVHLMDKNHRTKVTTDGMGTAKGMYNDLDDCCL